MFVIHEFSGQGTLESSRLPDVEHSVVTLCLWSVVHSLTCVFLGKYRSPHVHPTSQVCHCTWSLLPVFPSVSTASDKCWGTRLDQWYVCCTAALCPMFLAVLQWELSWEIRIFLIACSQQLHFGITYDFYMGLSHVCVGVLPNQKICLPYFSLGKHRTHK